MSSGSVFKSILIELTHRSLEHFFKCTSNFRIFNAIWFILKHLIKYQSIFEGILSELIFRSLGPIFQNLRLISWFSIPFGLFWLIQSITGTLPSGPLFEGSLIGLTHRSSEQIFKFTTYFLIFSSTWFVLTHLIYYQYFSLST